MAEGNGTRKGVANCGKINNKVLGPPSLGARRRRRQHASRPKGRPSPAVGVAANHRRRRPQPRRLIRGRRALHSSRSPSWAFLRGRGGPSLRIRRPVISSAMAAAPRPSSCPRRCARRPEHSGGHPSGALCPDSTRDSAPPQFGRRLLSSGDDCGGPLVPGWQRCTRGRVCFAPFSISRSRSCRVSSWAFGEKNAFVPSVDPFGSFASAVASRLQSLPGPPPLALHLPPVLLHHLRLRSSGVLLVPATGGGVPSPPECPALGEAPERVPSRRPHHLCAAASNEPHLRAPRGLAGSLSGSAAKKIVDSGSRGQRCRLAPGSVNAPAAV